MSRFIVSLLLCFSQLLIAKEEAPLTVVSGEAEYNGKDITLVGEVVVEHALGTISAHQFTISPGIESEKQFSQLTMSNDVQIQLQNGGTLSCQSASVDYDQLRGTFLGNPEKPDVVFSYLDKPDSELVIKGLRMEAHFIFLPDSQKKPVLNQIQVYDQVRIDFNQSYSITGDQLVWNDLDQTLTLKGNTKGNHADLMTFKTDHELIMKRNEKKEIKRISCPQETEIVYFDKKQEIVHKINCYGLFEIDHEHAEARLHSPRDSEDQVKEGFQVYLEDMLGEMSANDVQIKYNKVDKRLEPSKVILDGQVKIFNRFDGHTQESSSVLQYALADHVEYDPNLQEMVLSSQEGHRVLFFDKMNSVQMSAPTLKISFDKKNGKEKVQGLGDVRFTFIERELDQLKQRFRKVVKDD